jgi:hypothetical protein
MKLQRYVTNDGVMPPGTWVKASDAEALEKRIEELERMRCAYEARVFVLEKALRECEEQSQLQGPCWVEVGAIVKKALEGK